MLRGIEQYSHLWLIWGFSENEGKWSPTVRPPKLGGNKRIGVFATRSPFRPNSLGLSCVKLQRIETTASGKVLIVSGADLVDGTPVFDIKPYLPYVDCINEANGGFSDEHKNDVLAVEIPSALREKISNTELTEITEVLSLNPRPSYQDDTERIYKMSYKDFTVEFKCNSESIYVVEIIKGEADDGN
jgi:tRNA-Thr(GGU) m(6)t(6)A37 methyltransferase TsaA